jgi:hypothetical protein
MRRTSPFLSRLAVLVGATFLGVLSSACAAGAPKAADFPGAPPAMAEASPAMAGAVAPAAAPGPGPTMQAAPTAPAGAPSAADKSPGLAKSESDKSPRLEADAKPLLIYEAQLGIQVQRESFTSSIERAIDVAESLGGYLLSRSDTGVTLRVPSGQFRAALKQLDTLGTVTRRSVTAQDVSEQFHDLEVRLKNLESVRNRLEQFLARATNVTEALTVGKELENVTRQIDEIKGRLQFLRTRAAYSLIAIALEPKAAEVVAKGNAGPPPPPPPRPRKLPVKWLNGVGLDDLLAIEEE